jgi:hypothetical protein
MFLLTVFVLAQFFLSREISGRDQVLNRLNSQINELTQLLALERSGKAGSGGYAGQSSGVAFGIGVRPLAVAGAAGERIGGKCRGRSPDRGR